MHAGADLTRVTRLLAAHIREAAEDAEESRGKTPRLFVAPLDESGPVV
jgi:hypothetical protein